MLFCYILIISAFIAFSLNFSTRFCFIINWMLLPLWKFSCWSYFLKSAISLSRSISSYCASLTSLAYSAFFSYYFLRALIRSFSRYINSLWCFCALSIFSRIASLFYFLVSSISYWTFSALSIFFLVSARTLSKLVLELLSSWGSILSYLFLSDRSL